MKIENWLIELLKNRISFLYSESMDLRLSRGDRYLNYQVMKELEILLDKVKIKLSQLAVGNKQ